MTLETSGGEAVEPCPLSVPPEQPAAAVATPGSTLEATSRRESDEDYPVVVRLDDKSRIIECKDGIQWIAQHRYGGRWRNISFYLDRDVMIERSGATGDALAVLQALPARYGYVEPIIAYVEPVIHDEPAASPAPRATLLPEGSYRSLEAEASIEFDANGFPELPAFLDRRPKDEDIAA
jgi:hypothetical protein